VADGAQRGGPPSRFSLGLLFGVVYFVQGIGEPTTGLLSQPVSAILKGRGEGAAEIAGFMALLTLPWSIKPLYGLLTDFVPFFGSRRRSYLVVSTAAAAVALLGLSSATPGSTALLLAVLFVPAVAFAFSDVVVDALMVEQGQPRGLTGWLQSVQWASIYAATILTGVVGGALTQRGQPELAFAVCGGAVVVSLGLALFVVREAPAPARTHSAREALAELFAAARRPAVVAVGAFLFLWSFNPFAASVLYLHATVEIGLSEQEFGNATSVLGAAAMLASIAYGFYCRRVSFRALVHVSIALGVVSTLAYLFFAGPRSAYAVSAAVGFTYMTATLVQLDLAARSCPPHVAGTTFALLMSLSNLAVAGSGALGGSLYESLAAGFSADVAFRSLVVLGALFTCACWLLVPWLRRQEGVLMPGPAISG
jgi:predicted MFS family arabinose efflux permease